MIKLTDNEQVFFDKFYQLKNKSGTHSPSITSILKELGISEVKVDACFLSNPYATELFLEYFNEEIIKSYKIKDLFEAYPPQNLEIAQNLQNAVKISAKNLFVGNGAIEIIQAILHTFVTGKIVVNIPTFSSYYEFIKKEEDVIFFKLNKEENFVLNIDMYIEFVKSQRPNALVLINPNNPNGDYIPHNAIINLLKELSFVDNIIIDESFIHFAYEDLELSMVSANELLKEHPNLILIKSMSKDFGIAGIRAGYGIMNEERVHKLLKNGYLWNVSGIADYFFKLYASENFRKKYELVRKKYIMNTLMFLNELKRIPQIKVYPSKANFALVELLDGSNAKEMMIKLLYSYGVYVRECSDKIGLDGQFLRIASRSFDENIIILEAFKNIYSN